MQEQQGVSGSLLETYRQLIAARKASVALRRGAYLPVTVDDGAVWAFVRDHADQQVLVVINVGGSAKTCHLDLASYGIPGGVTQPASLVGGATPAALTDANKASWPLSLGAYGYAILDLDVVAPAPPVAVVDGRNLTTAAGAGAVLATQDSPTHLGDNVSEADRLLARVAGDSLFVGITGNLGLDGTGLALLLDVAPGGQNVLDTSSLSPPPSGPEHLTGMQLDAGFEPDVMLFMNAFSGTIYVDRYDLLTGGGVAKTYLGQGFVGSGNGVLSGGVNPDDIRVALDNTNTTGVSAVGVVDAALAVTGSEWYLSLAGLGHAGGPVKMAAFILQTSGDVSNQWLPPLGGIVGTLGVAPDLTTFSGLQYSTIGGTSGVGDGRIGNGTIAARATSDSGQAVISFSLPEKAIVDLTVLDVRGRMIRRLLATSLLAAGAHDAPWDGRDNQGRTAASGVYFFRLTAGSERAQGRIVLVR